MRFFTMLGAALATVSLANPAAADTDTVLVAGASGKTGRAVIPILQQQGYTVRAMVRDKAKAGDLGAGVEVIEADVTAPQTLTTAVKGAAYVISTIGASSAKPPNDPENVDFQGVANLADAARAASVKHFVLMSSIGAGDDNPETPLNKVFGMVLMWKGKGEAHLRRSGVPYTIVRPGGLGNCEAAQSGLKMQPGNAGIGGIICRADVGLVMADALRDPDAAGKTVAVVGDKAASPGAWKSAWKDIPRDE